MTEAEAVKLANELDRTLFNDLPNDDVPGRKSRVIVVNRIAAALLAASRPGEGFIRDSRGNDHPRTVVGTTEVLTGEGSGSVYDTIEVPHLPVAVDIPASAAKGVGDGASAGQGGTE